MACELNNLRIRMVFVCLCNKVKMRFWSTVSKNYRYYHITHDLRELVGLYPIYLTKTCQIYSISCIFAFLYNETAILSFSKRIHTKCVCLVFNLTWYTDKNTHKNLNVDCECCKKLEFTICSWRNNSKSN